MFKFFFDKNKTFKPRKKFIAPGTRRYELYKKAEATLGSGDMRASVALPPGEDLNEWLAVNTVDCYNEINLLYGTLQEFCTPETCATMSAGPKYEYLWADGQTIKTPIRVPAPEYIDYLMTWVDAQLSNEAVFPTNVEQPFPKNFVNHVKVIFKRLFRVYAHIYYSHFAEVVRMGAEAHLNTCFKHFICFVLEFDLVQRTELRPLEELIDRLLHKRAGEGELGTTLEEGEGKMEHSDDEMAENRHEAVAGGGHA